MKDLIVDLRRTLIARIIPNLPLTPNTNDGTDRDWVRKRINQFEFDYYFKEALDKQKKELEEIRNLRNKDWSIVKIARKLGRSWNYVYTRVNEDYLPMKLRRKLEGDVDG